MTKRASATSIKCILSITLCALVTLICSSCSNHAEKARSAVEQHLKGQGIQEVKLTLFCTSQSIPDKAYVSVMVTHNFANASGEPQKEYLGYIMKQEGKEWRVEQSAAYTKEEQRALDLLAGRKQ